MFGVVGDVILDIIVQADAALQWGSDVVGRISFQGGGSAANCASWLANLGNSVRFGGAVGQDLVGELSRAELEKYGVETFLVTKTDSTGTILIFLDEQGERTMITSRGANLQLEAADLPSGFFRGLGFFHLTAYSFFGSEQLATNSVKLLAQAREQGIVTSVDPSSYALLQEFGVEKFLVLVEGASLIFPNLEEGRVLTGKDSPQAIVKTLTKSFPQVVLTLGAEGCLCGRGDDLWHVPPAQRVPAVDTTGAGDAFVAGFLHEFARSSSLSSGAAYGNLVASQCVQKYGARPLRMSD